MYQTILVPWDGSTLSETALAVALPLARRQGASVELVHVHQRPALVGLAPMYDTGLDIEQRDSMRSNQRSLAQRVSEEYGVPVQAEILDGDTLPTLVAYTKRTGPDLVVMASHGRGALSRLLLGSVTEGMVRQLHIPVLVTRGGMPDAATSESGTAGAIQNGALADTPMFPRVLVPLDGSAAAEAIFPAISAIVMPDEVTLALLRVVTPLSLSVSPSNLPLEIGGLAPLPYMADVPDEEAHAAVYLDDVAASLSAIGIRATTHVVVHPNVATAILNFASESPFASGDPVDLIALAPHERTGTERLLLGSVTDKVLRGTAMPVLLHHHAPAASLMGINSTGSEQRHDVPLHG